MKRITHEQYLARLNELNPRLRVAGTYVCQRTQIEHHCLDCNKSFMYAPGVLIHNGKGRCPRCNVRTLGDHSTYVLKLAQVHPHIECLEEYVNSGHKLQHRCKQCKSTWSVTPNALLRFKTGCRMCMTSRGYSNLADKCMHEIAKASRFKIQSAGAGGEFTIPGTRFKVDGYHARTGTVIEFHGDRWHGNPKLYDANFVCSPKGNKTAGELLRSTRARERKIRALGYRVISIWEHDYKTRPTVVVARVASQLRG